MLLLLLSLFTWAGECEDPVQPADIAAKTDDAQLAWATLDEEGFVEIVDALPEQIACLEQALEPSQAAAVHRMIALRAFLQDEGDVIRTSLRAATRAEPGYQLSDRIAPEGGKLWQVFDAAAKAPAESTEDLSVPGAWTTWVDGAQSRERAEGLPAIVQVGASRDDVRWSGLIARDGLLSLPDLGPAPAAGLGAPAVPPKAPSAGSNRGLWIGAGATGAAALGLFGASAGLRNSFDSSPTRGKYDAVKGTYIGSAGMAALTGGLVAAALIRKR